MVVYKCRTVTHLVLPSLSHSRRFVDTIIVLGSWLQTACDYELLAHEQSVTNSRCVVRRAARIQTAFSSRPRFSEARKERAPRDFFLILHTAAHPRRTKNCYEREKRGKGRKETYLFISVTITQGLAQESRISRIVIEAKRK